MTEEKPSSTPRGNEASFHVTFLCTGNLCRSPYAAALTRRIAEKEGWGEKIRVSSRGLLDLQAAPAHEYALKRGARLQLSLLVHRSCQVDEEHLHSCHLILCMAREHLEAIGRDFPSHAGRTFLLASYPQHGAEGEEISDPIGGSEEVFDEVFDKIEAALQPIFAALRRRFLGSP